MPELPLPEIPSKADFVPQNSSRIGQAVRQCESQETWITQLSSERFLPLDAGDPARRGPPSRMQRAVTGLR
jgi:hypothetical protein